MTKFSRRPDARPDELLDAAEARFTAEGYTAARVERIAHDAGVTVGTVYRYFPDGKEALFRAVVARHADASWSRGREIAEAYGSRTAREIVELLLRRWVDRLREGGEGRALLLVVREAVTFPDVVASWVEATIHKGCLAVERALRHGIERGEFPLLDVEATARALVSTVVNRHVWDATFRPTLPPLAERTDPTLVAIDLVVRGIPRAPGAGNSAPPPQAAEPHPVAAEREAEGEGGAGKLRIVTLRPRAS